MTSSSIAFLLMFIACLLCEAKALRLSNTVGRLAPSSRLVYQWRRHAPQPQPPAGADPLLSENNSNNGNAFQKLFPRSSPLNLSWQRFQLWKRAAIKPTFATRRRIPSLMASTAILLLTLMLCLTDVIGQSHQLHSPVAWRSSQHPQVAAVLPKTPKQTFPRGTSRKKTSKTGPVKTLTASALLAVSVAGGTLLGRKIVKDKAQQNGSGDTVEESVDEVLRETANDNLTQHVTGDGLPPLVEETPSTKGQRSNRQSKSIDKVQHETAAGKSSTDEGAHDNSNVGEQQVRAMVQKILNQYSQETSSNPNPPPPAGPQSGIAVASPIDVSDDTAKNVANSPFLPFSTKSINLREEQCDDDGGSGSGGSVSFFDAIQRMTPERITETTTHHLNPRVHLDPLPPGVLRRQPKSPHEEDALKARYAAIPDLGDRAYQILLDLGMFEEELSY